MVLNYKEIIPYLPEALEHKQIADTYLLKNYEKLSHQERVWIKSTLALNESLYTPFLGDISYSLIHKNAGFQIKKYSKPAIWTILLLDKHYASAPRLAAAIMTARLANIQNILAVWIETNKDITPTDISQNIFATLELSGIETSLILTTTELTTLINYLKTYGQGRILYFPDEVLTSKKILPETIPYWQDTIKPCLLIHPCINIDMKILEWAHPNALIHYMKEPFHKIQNIDALYCLPQQEHIYSEYSTPRIFGPGLEAYWFHPNLLLSFFIEELWSTTLLHEENQ